jgi:UMF1 family MFS transporter
MTLKPVTFDLVSGADAAQASFLSVGIWWAFFSLPLLLTVREPINREQISIVTAIRGGLTQRGNTFQQIRKLKTIFLFLAAYWLYIDGVNTIIVMALDYGLSIGFKSTDLILVLLITQFIGFLSAIVFGYLSRKAGTKAAIYLAIAVYLLLPFWGFLMNNRTEFYLLAMIIGLVQGDIQALSRLFYCRIIPFDQSGE